MEAKRRLSSNSNSGLLKMCDGDSSDDEDMTSSSIACQEKSIYTFPKRVNGRRRSSIGGMSSSSKSPVNAAEQARITEMYKTVIQMSSENVKTFCCNFSLIEMSVLINMSNNFCIEIEIEREKFLELRLDRPHGETDQG